jgi:hypothetical protein
MIVLLSAQKGGKNTDQDFMQTQQELQQLREFASNQQAQLQATQQQTQMLLEAQQRQMQQQTQVLESTVNDTQKRLPQTGGIQQTLEELRDAVASDELEEDNLDLQIKSWIESS